MSDTTINQTMREETAGRARLRPGDEILGRYVVEIELGQGGMGVVYQCLDKVGGVKVAVKGLPPEVSHNANEMEEVRANYSLVEGLRHSNICGIKTLEKDARGDYYLVMDLAQGVNLNRWLGQHPEATDVDKIAILRQIARALDYAHARKVIHRDVKPENVMVADDGTAQVLDFGLAAQVRSSLSRTSRAVTSTSGTPGYKAPEQWLGRPQGPASDQYALGVVAYRMFAGFLPFDGDDLVILGQAVLTAPVEPVEGASDKVNSALVKALAKKPADRFPSCAAFVSALEGGGISVEPTLDEPAPGEEMTLALPGGVQMTFCWCPATTSAAWKRISGGKDYFVMGSPSYEEGRCWDETQHQVKLTQGYWLGRNEVTQEQWKSVMGSNPSLFKGDDRPVECVLWENCQEFIGRCKGPTVRFALPTEAQWEYACRAGSMTPYSFGSSLNGDRANCDGNYPYGTVVKGCYRGGTTPVGSYEPNKWGLCDMHGNVFEWCEDWYGGYHGDCTDPTGPDSGRYHVLRGGGWFSVAQTCRSAYRSSGIKRVCRPSNLGFRLVCFPDALMIELT